MYQHRDRSVIYSGAAVASLFFFLLFWGVYSPMSPLAESDLSAIARTIFFAVPVVASGSILVAARIYPHDLGDDIAERLADAERNLSNHWDSYETAFEDSIGSETLDDLEERFCLESVSSMHRSHVDRCDELQREIQDQMNQTEASLTRLSESQNLRAKVNKLPEPHGQVRNIETSIRSTLGEQFEQTLCDRLWIESEYGDAYELDLGPTYRTVDFETLDEQVPLDECPGWFRDQVENGSNDLSTILDAFETALDHVDRAERRLRRAERTHERREGEIKEQLASVRSRLSTLDAEAGERAEEIFVRGELRDAEVTSVADTRELLDEARDALHSCRFGEIDTKLGGAEAAAGRLTEAAEFLSSLEGPARNADDKRVTVRLPRIEGDPFEPAVLETLGAAFGETYQAEFEPVDGRHAIALVPVNEQTVNVDWEESATESEQTALEDDGGAGQRTVSGDTAASEDGSDDGGIDPQETTELDEGTIRDGVNLLLNEARRLADQHNLDDMGNTIVEIPLEELPELASEDAVLAEFERQLEAEPLIDDVTEPEGNSSRVKITSDDGTDIERALTKTIKRFHDTNE